MVRQYALAALVLGLLVAGCGPVPAAAGPGSTIASSPIPTVGSTPSPAPPVESTPSSPGPFSEADRVAIYAAVIRRVCDRDDTFGGALQPTAVYLVRRTDDGVGDPAQEQAPSAVLAQATQSAILEALADLPTRFRWVDAAADVPREAQTGRVVDGGAIVTVGNIHAGPNGRVLLAGSIYVANLAAGGQTYVLERQGDTWQVTGNTGTQWMS